MQVEFEFGTDLDDAVNKLQTALNRIDAQSPQDVDPVVFAGSTDDLPAVVLAASGGGGDERALADKLAETVIPEIAGIDGVRTAEVTGAREEIVVITPDPRKLAAARIAPTAIGAALQANGVAIPAGALTQPDRATIFALLPMALGLTGEGGFISQPLAIVVIGGLISSTLLTLVLVPTLYTMVERAKKRLRGRRGGGAAPAEVPAAASPAVDRSDVAEQPGPAAVRPALNERTDQFEVLRLPRSMNSP